MRNSKNKSEKLVPFGKSNFYKRLIFNNDLHLLKILEKLSTSKTLLFYQGFKLDKDKLY